MWDTGNPLDWGMGRKWDSSAVCGGTGSPWNSPGILVTWGWERQWDSRVWWTGGLRDGKDSGTGGWEEQWDCSAVCGLGDWERSEIPVLCVGYWETLGLPWSPSNLGMGRIAGFQCGVWDTGNSCDSPGVPGTGVWEGQWDTSAVWGTLGVPGTALES